MWTPGPIILISMRRIDCYARNFLLLCTWLDHYAFMLYLTMFLLHERSKVEKRRVSEGVWRGRCFFPAGSTVMVLAACHVVMNGCGKKDILNRAYGSFLIGYEWFLPMHCVLVCFVVSLCI